jgi:hypothetical protein
MRIRLPMRVYGNPSGWFSQRRTVRGSRSGQRIFDALAYVMHLQPCFTKRGDCIGRSLCGVITLATEPLERGDQLRLAQFSHALVCGGVWRRASANAAVALSIQQVRFFVRIKPSFLILVCRFPRATRALRHREPSRRAHLGADLFLRATGLPCCGSPARLLQLRVSRAARQARFRDQNQSL